jgi:outer membrane protein TolC
MSVLDFLTGTKRPEDGAAICAPDDLRSRLLRLNRPTAPWRVVDGTGEGVDLIAEWKIVDAQWFEIFAKAGLERAFSIVLRIDPEAREVRAQDREYQISWEAGVPTLAFSGQWSRGQTHSFATGAAYGFTETLAPGKIYQYRFATEEIKSPIQEAVTGCGWTYKGVVFGNP